MHSTSFSICWLAVLAGMQCEYTSVDNFDQNNVTILHEVTNESIQLNTHEVLPPKSVQKKPYAIINKPTEYVNIPVLKAYNAHTVAFDFNLGDLEDVHEAVLPDIDIISEEHHLQSNTNDEEFKKLEFVLPSTVSTYVTPMSTEASNSPSTMSMPVNETTTNGVVMANSSTPPPSSADATTPMMMTSTEISTTPGGLVSPHIFKILSKNKSRGKVGHAFFQKDEQQKAIGNQFNSISTFFGDTDENSTTNAPQTQANIFQMMVNLYDHFYWQPSEIQTKVSPECGIEMRQYLSALNSNYEWAQKAYDSSGHYRGQLFFGSNKWLGERQFCNELNKNGYHEEQKHMNFEFFVATIHIAAWVPTNLTAEIQLGECLPKSCSSRDIEKILNLDPHAQMLSTTFTYNNNSHIFIQGVRTVPGRYCLWKDVKFGFFFIFCFLLVCVVLAASWYESNLNERKRLHQICYGNKLDPKIGSNPDLNHKDFEIYQMAQINTVADKNNVESESDLKKKSSYSKKKITMSEDKQDSSGGSGLKVKQTDSDLNANLVELSCTTNRKLGLRQEILLCFAFQRNTYTIFSVDSKSENQTSCVHGLRVLAVLWTIMVHTYLQLFTIGENRFLRVITERSFIYQFVGNATFSVDTFFFISGFLVTLLFLKHEQEKKRTNVEGNGFIWRSLKESSLIVISRYIRLTPVYMFVIVFNELSLRYTFDKSVFQPTVAIDTCSDYWWRNILYINNFFPLNQFCMIWSWYMANDMQFYIMATLLLIFSTRYFKSTIVVLLATLVSSWGISGVISIHHNYTHKVANPFESFNFLYDKPWQRVGTYIVGMATGYIVYVTKTPPRISFRLNLILWTASLGLLFVVICGVWSGELNVIATAFYVSVGHTAFGVGLVWVVLSCCWGLAKPVNNFLSYPGLLPLSRLTYCTYLIHPVIMLLTSYQMEGTVHLNNMLILTVFLGNAVISFAVAFFISVIFEAPVLRLLKIFFKK